MILGFVVALAHAKFMLAFLDQHHIIYANASADPSLLFQRLIAHLRNHPSSTLTIYQAHNQALFQALKQQTNFLATFPKDARLMAPFNSVSQIWAMEDQFQQRVQRQSLDLNTLSSVDFNQTPLCILFFKTDRILQSEQQQEPKQSSGEKLVQMSPHAFVGLLMAVVFILTVSLGVHLLYDIKSPLYFPKTAIAVGKES